MALMKCVVLLFAVSTVSCNINTQDIVFHLFTKANPTQSQPLLASVNSISTSSFNIFSKTVFTIHNSGESVVSNFNAYTVDGYLTSSEPDINVICVDWSVACPLYAIGLSNVNEVGDIIASFINILANNFGYSPSNVEIVGAGLGGHIAGIAARKAVSIIPHVVALDPSLVGWTYHPDRLRSSDATVVEVLHTTSGILGYDYPIGDLDFYANDGAYQPNCGTTAECSYEYAFVYYAESLKADADDGPKFRGTKCEDYEEAREQDCDGLRNVVFGGYQDKTGITGIYQFKTNYVPPFATD